MNPLTRIRNWLPAAPPTGRARPPPRPHPPAGRRTRGPAAAPATLTVNTFADDTAADNFLALREAITLVNAGDASALDRALDRLAQVDGGFGGGDAIRFDAALAGTAIDLNSPLPTLAKDVDVTDPERAATQRQRPGGGPRLQRRVRGRRLDLRSRYPRRARRQERRWRRRLQPRDAVACRLPRHRQPGRVGRCDRELRGPTVSGCTLAFNSATVGGAVSNLGTLVVTASTVTANAAAWAGRCTTATSSVTPACRSGPERSRSVAASSPTIPRRPAAASATPSAARPPSPV